MTSGAFHSIEVSSIVINRTERQRSELTDIPDLAESIRDNGLINPILVTRELVLVAGERRLAAVKSLGWTHITAQFQDEASPETLHILELEENVRRVDLPWPDRCRAVEKYHAARKAMNPEWTIEATAEELNVTPQDVGDKVRIAKAMEKNPEIEKMQRFSIARNYVARANERAAASQVEALEASLGIVKPKAESILNASFLDWAPHYEGIPFNLIHCDFPYGVNMNKSDQAGAARAGLGDYEDSEEVYWTLVKCLGDNLSRIAADQCHVLFWFSMKFYKDTVDALRAFGLAVDPFPLVWYKSDGMGILPDPSRGPRRVYETALLCSRGDRKIVRAVNNTFSHPRGGGTHLSEKPIEVLKYFFGMLVDSSTRLLDPTAGSGTALRAAEAAGASFVQGIELDPEFARKANEALAEFRALKEIAV